jgi:hypothetical protein
VLHAATRIVDRRRRPARIALVIVVQRPPGYSLGIGRIRALFLEMAGTTTPQVLVRPATDFAENGPRAGRSAGPAQWTGSPLPRERSPALPSRRCPAVRSAPGNDQFQSGRVTRPEDRRGPERVGSARIGPLMGRKANVRTLKAGSGRFDVRNAPYSDIGAIRISGRTGRALSAMSGCTRKSALGRPITKAAAVVEFHFLLQGYSRMKMPASTAPTTSRKVGPKSRGASEPAHHA